MQEIKELIKHPFFIGLVIFVAIFLLYQNRPAPTAGPNETAVVAQVAPQLKLAPTIEVVTKKPIKGYAAPIKSKLRLPDEVIADQNQTVIAASRVRATDRPQTVTTVLDSETGETKTYVKQEPLPWLAFNTRGDLGIYGGIKNGQPTARLQVRQELLQVKAVHIGGIASFDQPLSGPVRADYFVGVGIWGSW